MCTLMFMPADPTWPVTRAKMLAWLTETGQSYGQNGPVESVSVGAVMAYWDRMVTERPELARILREIHAEDTSKAS